jgi:putative DNA primase/helicase
MALVASVTAGGRWPDGTRARRGRVALWSGEDDPKDTLVPRLLASGANMSQVHFIGSVVSLEGKRSFDPARDVEPLKRELLELGDVRLLIVDPIVSAITGDSHKNAEVRRGLQPLVDLAALMRCAILGITHFSKGTAGRDPAERVTGSLAFGALARVVLVAAKHKEESEDNKTKRILCRAKSNIGPDDGGFEYDLQQSELKAHPGIFASYVLWGNPVEGTARELLAVAEDMSDDGEGGSLGDAKRFLTDLLVDGPMSVKIVKADADGAGYAWTTIRRAKDLLGIEAVKEGGRFGEKKQQWVWRLPEGAQGEHLLNESQKVLKNPEDAQEKKVSTFCKNEHLLQNSTPDTEDAHDELLLQNPNNNEEIEVTV